MRSFFETKLLDAGLKLTVIPPQETITYRSCVSLGGGYVLREVESTLPKLSEVYKKQPSSSKSETNTNSNKTLFSLQPAPKLKTVTQAL